MAPPVNRDVLIGVSHWLTFNLSRKEGDACAALGRQQSARSEVGGDRRTLRTLSLTRAGSGTRHGAVAGALWAVVVCWRQDRYELIDGFKRLGAARGLAQIPRLSARLMEADERQAKAAIYGLNRAGGRTRELEEAWIIQALVREDGLSQVEVAELLGRHKSWVCRRLALIERLGPKAKDELRVGLLTPTAARQIVRLPQGNQTEVLEAIRRQALSSAELGGVVDLWLRCSERRQQEYLLAHPREALSQAKGVLQ